MNSKVECIYIYSIDEHFTIRVKRCSSRLEYPYQVKAYTRTDSRFVAYLYSPYRSDHLAITTFKNSNYAKRLIRLRLRYNSKKKILNKTPQGFYRDNYGRSSLGRAKYIRKVLCKYGDMTQPQASRLINVLWHSFDIHEVHDLYTKPVSLVKLKSVNGVGPKTIENFVRFKTNLNNIIKRNNYKKGELKCI